MDDFGTAALGALLLGTDLLRTNATLSQTSRTPTMTSATGQKTIASPMGSAMARNTPIAFDVGLPCQTVRLPFASVRTYR